MNVKHTIRALLDALQKKESRGQGRTRTTLELARVKDSVFVTAFPSQKKDLESLAPMATVISLAELKNLRGRQAKVFVDHYAYEYLLMCAEVRILELEDRLDRANAFLAQISTILEKL